jgi:RNA polymerase-binding protein DksA
MQPEKCPPGSDEKRTIRDRLHKLRAELLERHRQVELDLQRRKGELVKDDDDRAIQVANDEALEAIEASTLRSISEIDAALDKLAMDVYGFCEVCGNDIPRSRLLVLPQASTCVDCAKDSAL